MICIFAASVLTVYEKNLDQKQFRSTRTDPGFHVRVCVGGVPTRMFLPPANVWGKVMFLLACVILFPGGRSLYDDTSCLVVWSPVPSRGLRLWSHVSSGGGVSDPPYGKERAVHILLECILVAKFSTTKIKARKF